MQSRRLQLLIWRQLLTARAGLLTSIEAVILRPMAKLTPAMQQYFDLKGQHKDAVLFFQMGDFFEMFGEDAIETSRLLDITLTARNKGKENELPMCGIPVKAAAAYIAKLTKMGKKVAVVEQITEPSPGTVVEREVTKIVTHGTTCDDTILQVSESNFLCAIVKDKAEFVKYAKGEIIQKILPTLDTFEIALKNTSDKEKFVKGIEMVYAQLFSLLEAEGLKKIEADGKKFDPYLHEVMLKEKSDKDEDIILEELQKGYMLNDKVLRHTKVKVSEKIDLDKKDKK